MHLLAEEPVSSAAPVTETSDPTPSPSAAPEAADTPAPTVAETAVARAADVTAPVIKEIELVENGKTLKNGDSITVNVRATDADSGINTIYVSVDRDSYSAFSFTLTASESDPELYTGTYTLDDCIAGTYKLGFVKVGDKAGNSADGTIAQQNEDGTYTYLYTFDVEDDTVIHVTDIHDGLSDEIVERSYFSSTNSDDFTITIDQDLGQYQQISAMFVSEETSQSVVVRLSNGAEGGKIFSLDYLNSVPYVSEEKVYSFKLSSIYMDADGGAREFVIDQDISTIGFQIRVVPYEYTDYSVTATDAEFTKNGEIVHAGDELEFIIYADGEGVENSYAYVHIEPAADLWGIEETSYSVNASYDSARGGYVGTWTVTDNTYPCEWYIDYANIYPVNGGEMLGAYSDSRNPAYVNVQKDGTFTEEVHDLHITVYAFDSNGNSTPIMTTEVSDVPRRYTLREIGVTLPEMRSPMAGMNQTGWKDGNGEITEDTELLNESYGVDLDYTSLTIYAAYDKVIATGSYYYIGDDGKYCIEQNMELFDPGTTYGEAIEAMLQYEQSDMTTAYTFTGWDETSTYLNEDDVLNSTFSNYLTFSATYAEGLMVGIYKEYVMDNGFSSIMSELNPGVTAKVVAEGTTYQEVYDDVVAEPMPAIYPGLRFKGWKYNEYQNKPGDVVSNGGVLNISADYENSIVRYIVDERFENTGMMEFTDSAYFECKLVEAGDEVVIPVTVPGFESVRWLVVMGDLPVTFTAEAGQDYAFYGVPGNSTDTPVDPVEPEETPDPVRPADDLISQTISAANNAEEGGTVVMEMGNANTVPSQVLAAAKGKDVNIVLNMGGYTWTINGKNIYADNPKDINMQVIFNTDAVPSEIVKKLADGNESMQLQLVHNGDFGFKASLTFNAGSDKAGQYGNLYYYNSEGRLIFNDAGEIAADGSLSLDFSHASDYVVVYADRDLSVNNNPTGVWNSPAPYVATIVVCAIGALLIRKRQLAK